MKRRLEELDPGTAVYCEERRVGEVRGVYSIGESQLAEFLNVFWESNSSELLIPTSDVSDITDSGVVLSGTVESFSDMTAFGANSELTLKRLH